MKIAIVSDETNIVENVAIADGEFNPGVGLSSIPSDTAKVGDTWDGDKFTSPVVESIPIPHEEYAALSTDAERIVYIATSLKLIIPEEESE